MLRYVIIFLLNLFFYYNAFATIECDSLLAIPSTKEECAQCPNRDFGVDLVSKHMIYEEQNVCYLKECPEGYFFDVRHKNCLPCDYKTDQCLDVSPEECEKCPNRQMNKYKFTTQCEMPFSCPEDKPAMSIWGGFEDSCEKECHSCEDAGESFWADDCSVCPGYEFEESPEYNFMGKKLCVNKNFEEPVDDECILDFIETKPGVFTLSGGCEKEEEN